MWYLKYIFGCLLGTLSIPQTEAGHAFITITNGQITINDVLIRSWTKPQFSKALGGIPKDDKVSSYHFYDSLGIFLSTNSGINLNEVDAIVIGFQNDSTDPYLPIFAKYYTQTIELDGHYINKYSGLRQFKEILPQCIFEKEYQWYFLNYKKLWFRIEFDQTETQLVEIVIGKE